MLSIYYVFQKLRLFKFVDSFENNNVLATKLYFHTLQPLATPSIYNYYLKNMDFSGLNAQNLNCNRQKRPPVVFAIKEW